MKFSEQWLREWVNPSVDTDALVHQLTMAGLEVDSAEAVASSFEHVVVGEVKSVESHPNADRLCVCSVDIGEKEPVQIVCGAKNVKQGMKVPTAKIGATFATGLKIKKSKLRDVESHGMLCSAEELGLAEESDGIYPLPADAPVGESVRDILNLDDIAIDVDLTPNRGDCLSVWGIAREVGAINQMKLNLIDFPVVPAASDNAVTVDIKSDDACPNYVGRVIKGVDMKADAPVWMIERLRRSGIRSISPVVDVTNYVMLELGQPMHAFDLSAVHDGVVVRMAKAGEKIVLLDENEVTLQENTLVIADKQNPIAIAGVMGGLDSAVSNDTRDIFLESAFFTPNTIAGKARSYGMSTDSSHRFERGVSPDLQEFAIERATNLLLSIVGGTPGPVTVVSSSAYMPKPVTIHLRTARVNQILGEGLTTGQIETYLRFLGMDCIKAGEGLDVTVPVSRFDITLEVDLIEEVVRLYGYDNIPTTEPVARLRMATDVEESIKPMRFAHALCDAGYHEVVTYSFVDDAQQKRIDRHHDGIPLVNPISSEMSVMRTTLLPGLIDAIRYNQNRQQNRLRLFETGLRFIQADDALLQQNMIAGVVVGAVKPVQWDIKSSSPDFFDVKGDLENLFALTHDPESFSFTETQHPALHPGQGADIMRGAHMVGFVGMLNPALYASLDVQGPIAVFELQMDVLKQAKVPSFTKISKFPEIKRDLAFIVKENISLEQIVTAVRDAAGALLIDVALFDLYAGKGIPEGQKSLAITLTLQTLERTLTDAEVNDVVNHVTETLRQHFAATLRD